MKKIILNLLALTLITLQINAQQKNITGTVYAFKDLPLKNISVSASKAKTTALTDSLGRFKLVCELTDKLEFSGSGFNKLTHKLEKEEKYVKAKLIFKGGDKNISLAVENNHAQKEDLEKSIQNHADQNFEYFSYPDVMTAISRIYAGNDNIRVRADGVYVRNDKNTFSAVPAIFIVNDKLALDIKDIQTRDIESIEIIPDGSSMYGPGAANGVVQITTFNKKIRF